jgi:LEA14-like dessication related protein
MKIFNNQFNYFVLVIMVLALTGCSTIQEIKIGDVRKVDLISINNNVLTLDLTIPIENPNAFSVKVKLSDLKVMLGANELGKVKQMDDLVISRKSTKEYTMRILVEITDVKNSFVSAFSIFSGKKPDIRFNGTIKVCSFLYGKTFKVEGYELMK